MAKTLQEIIAETKAMQDRIKNEGITQGGNTIVQAGAYNPTINTINQPKPATPVVTTPVAPTAPIQPNNPVMTPITPVKTNTPTGAYSVVAGDNLSTIAAKNGLSLQQLLDSNPQYKANPNMVQVGANLIIPKFNQPTNQNNNGITTSNVGNVNNNNINSGQNTSTQLGQPVAGIATSAGQAQMSPSELTSLISLTPEEMNSIRTNLGIDDLALKTYGLPTKSTEDIYREAYDSSGLKSIKDQIAQKTETLNKAINNISENPWLPEASRVGRIKRLQELANADIANLQNTYNAGIAEINDRVVRSTNDFNTAKEINIAKLDYLLKKAESDASTLKSEKVFRYMPEYLKAYGITRATEKAKTPTTPESKNKYISASTTVRTKYNNWFNKGLATSKDGKVAPEYYNQIEADWKANNYDPAIFTQLFGKYLRGGSTSAQVKADPNNPAGLKFE